MRRVPMIFYPKIMGTTTPQGGVFLIKIKDFNQKTVLDTKLMAKRVDGNNLTIEFSSRGMTVFG